jgi:hypothetical protein
MSRTSLWPIAAQLELRLTKFPAPHRQRRFSRYLLRATVCTQALSVAPRRLGTTSGSPSLIAPVVATLVTSANGSHDMGAGIGFGQREYERKAALNYFLDACASSAAGGPFSFHVSAAPAQRVASHCSGGRSRQGAGLTRRRIFGR